MINFEVESVIHNHAKRAGEVNGRKYHTFAIRVSGEVEYTFKDKKVLLKAGEMMYLPKGSIYSYRVTSHEDAVYTIINMHGDFEGFSSECYSLSEFHGASFFEKNFADMWNFGNSADKYKCISLIYELISFVENVKYAEKKKFSIIDPAVAYLKKHIYDCNLKIDTLHKLCGVSDTYFRKIFIKRFGTSPKNYVMEKRLSKAKIIIDSGEFESVKELSGSVGYADSLYFGKIFKKHYGVPPSLMNAME